MKPLKVLITCGPTWAAIDDVRVLSNTSSGQMGHLIADVCVAKKMHVTLLEGPVTHLWSNPSVKMIKYAFFDELKMCFEHQLRQGYDVVIHAAAVSDYTLAKTFKGKIDSKKTLSLKLVSTPKIIESVKRLAPQSLLVGFKLEPSLTKANVADQTQDLFERSGCDWVVANSVDNGYQGYVLNKERKILYKTRVKKDLALALIKEILSDISR